MNIVIDRKKLIRALAYAAYFTAAFLVFLLFLFPFDRVKNRLESEVKARTPVELSIDRISPRFFNRFVLVDVVVSDQKGQVLFESPSVNTHISLFGLVRGLLSVSLRGPAYGGELTVKAMQGSKTRSFIVDANNLDIGSYSLFKVEGIKLSGKLGGSFDLTGTSGKGRLWVKNVTSRELKIKGFPVPDLDFDQGWVEAEVKGDRLTIKKLELDGKELKVQANGDVVMRERGTMNLTIKLKPSERLAREQAGLLSLLKNRDAEGFYLFSLGGTLDAPLPRL
jgi:type II secretion system protein N